MILYMALLQTKETRVTKETSATETFSVKWTPDCVGCSRRTDVEEQNVCVLYDPSSNTAFHSRNCCSCSILLLFCMLLVDIFPNCIFHALINYIELRYQTACSFQPLPGTNGTSYRKYTSSVADNVGRYSKPFVNSFHFFAEPSKLSTVARCQCV